MTAMKIEINVPKPTRRRLIGTGTLCSAFSALWLTAGSLPGADLSPKMVVAGLLVPFGVGAWSLAWAERRVRRESVPLRDDRPQRVFEQPETEADAEHMPAVINVRPVGVRERLEREGLPR